MSGSGTIAIIPARGGSKRVPGKNLLPLLGKPLIAWTIEAALKSNAVDRVVVSTDDPEIAAAAKSFGAEVPFMRPAELATDSAPTISVILDVLSKIPQSRRIFLLQPTSPLRTANHIDEAAKLMDDRKANAVISVSEAEHPPEWSNSLPEDGSMDRFLGDELKNKRSQDLPRKFRLNGAIYIADARVLVQERTFLLSRRAYAYRMDRESSIDIDSKIDLMIAEVMMRDRLDMPPSSCLPRIELHG
jgi:CMP-N,N'-diacetyllegionaminic acid synthase